MRQRCESCPTKLDCVSAFGIYWDAKSGGGEGCEHPFRYRVMDDAECNGKRGTAARPQEAGRR